MTQIVDASVAVKWFAKEERSNAAREVLNSGTLCAPEFVLLELFHALWNMARRGLFHIQDIEPSLRRARDAFEDLAPQAVLLQKACELAQLHSHSIYDCLYIAHAQREQATLITADDKQFAIARKARVDVQLL
jgi:predicted nucleic acid-binding protein